MTVSIKRQRVSRAESKQRTREEILDAAEGLLLEHGLRGTTTAKIADAAGRTYGSIYSNFDSKESLCAEVLFRCYMRTFTEVAAELDHSAHSIEDQVDRIVRWHEALTREAGLVALAGEYALAIHKDPRQRTVSQGHIEIAREMVGEMLGAAMPAEVPAEDRATAMNAVLATGTGLAVARTLGSIDDQQYIELLAKTLWLWVTDLHRGGGSAG